MPRPRLLEVQPMTPLSPTIDFDDKPVLQRHAHAWDQTWDIGKGEFYISFRNYIDMIAFMTLTSNRIARLQYFKIFKFFQPIQIIL